MAVGIAAISSADSVGMVAGTDLFDGDPPD